VTFQPGGSGGVLGVRKRGLLSRRRGWSAIT
jgi:hypothetical protein